MSFADIRPINPALPVSSQLKPSSPPGLRSPRSPVAPSSPPLPNSRRSRLSAGVAELRAGGPAANPKSSTSAAAPKAFAPSSWRGSRPSRAKDNAETRPVLSSWASNGPAARHSGCSDRRRQGPVAARPQDPRRDGSLPAISVDRLVVVARPSISKARSSQSGNIVGCSGRTASKAHARRFATLVRATAGEVESRATTSARVDGRAPLARPCPRLPLPPHRARESRFFARLIGLRASAARRGRRGPQRVELTPRR
jgi:hypothetical protein